ncbi:MAG: nitroreductase family protein [archaeon]
MTIDDAISHRIEVRDFSDDPVDPEVRHAVLDAGRLAPSGKNTQHWRFVLVTDEGDLAQLAELSTSGTWIEGADFAVVVTTDPSYHYHELDAGRAITHMQFAAFDRAVGSCIYTGYDDEGMHEFLDVPDDRTIVAVVGFGRPVDGLRGRKRRQSLSDVAYADRFGKPLAVE